MAKKTKKTKVTDTLLQEVPKKKKKTVSPPSPRVTKSIDTPEEIDTETAGINLGISGVL